MSHSRKAGVKIVLGCLLSGLKILRHAPDQEVNHAQVLGSLPPKEGQVEGMESMLAAVIKNAKNKAAEGIAAMCVADDMHTHGDRLCV